MSPVPFLYPSGREAAAATDPDGPLPAPVPGHGGTVGAERVAVRLRLSQAHRAHRRRRINMLDGSGWSPFATGPHLAVGSAP